jgi:hypothetical protein
MLLAQMQKVIQQDVHGVAIPVGVETGLCARHTVHDRIEPDIRVRLDHTECVGDPQASRARVRASSCARAAPQKRAERPGVLHHARAPVPHPTKRGRVEQAAMRRGTPSSR